MGTSGDAVPLPRDPLTPPTPLPRRVDAYVHTAGRTAREGRKGTVVSLLFDDAELMRLEGFKEELGFKLQVGDLRFLRNV